MSPTLSVLQALFLGLVQGLTEFLPVSSSGHLVLVRDLLGWPDPPLAFDVALHMGTAVALLAYFWRTWLSLALRPSRLLGLLVVSSIPIAIAGLLLSGMEDRLRTPQVIAAMLMLWGLALGVADTIGARVRTAEQLSFGGAFIIGIAQACALVPGTSRSGATTTAALALGLARDAAVRFAFMMALPAIVGAALFEAPRMLGGGAALDVGPMLAGFASAAACSLAAIHLMLKLVRRISFWPFVAYRVALGLLVLAVL